MSLRDRYNSLVEEAVALGITKYKPLKSHFRDSATGEQRVSQLEQVISAGKSGDTIPQGAEDDPEPRVDSEASSEASIATDQESTVSKTSAKKKAAVAKAATKKATNSKGKVTVPVKRSPAVLDEFGTREGTNQERLLLALWEKRGKKLAVSDAVKEVYGNSKEENRGRFKMVYSGLMAAIRDGKLPYTLEWEGRGEEATLCLASK